MNEHRDGVWTSNGLSADVRLLREHPASSDFIYVQTASGDYYAHKDELTWDNESVPKRKQSAQSGWMEITDDCLPPLEVPVWLYLPDIKQPVVGCRIGCDGEWAWVRCHDYYWFDGKWKTGANDADDMKPTHWMPLPMPPTIAPTNPSKTRKPTTLHPIVLHPIVLHLIYGDIHEMPLNVLREECPDMETYQKSNGEIDTRYQAAATVQAWLEGRLHRGGYLHDPELHAALDLIPRE